MRSGTACRAAASRPIGRAATRRPSLTSAAFASLRACVPLGCQLTICSLLAGPMLTQQPMDRHTPPQAPYDPHTCAFVPSAPAVDKLKQQLWPHEEATACEATVEQYARQCALVSHAIVLALALAQQDKEGAMPSWRAEAVGAPSRGVFALLRVLA
jgi:hypothetical protein